MTEYSLPFPGTTIGDAGPYPVGGATIPGWWDKAYLMNRAGGRISQTTLADIGVYYSVDDQLECTVAADTISIDVDTGASLVDGTLHYNDTDPVNVPIPAAGAGDDRIDLVVVRKNYQTAVTYTPGGGAPTVGPRETRITVVRGVESGTPATPTVTQDTTRATYWDIPLYTVQVDDGGALTDLTDLREYVDAETKDVWIQAMTGYNLTDGTEIPITMPTVSSTFPAVVLPDNKDAQMLSIFQVPTDYLSSLTVKSVLVKEAAGTGNLYGRSFGFGQGCGEQLGTHQASTSSAAFAMTQNEIVCIDSFSLTSPSVGDFITLRFLRDGNNVLDTIGDVVNGWGFVYTYLGWR